jgi:hypothetical protein
MPIEEEYSAQIKRLRDQVEIHGENLQNFAHRQDEFNSIGVDIRAELLRMDANQAEILRQLAGMLTKVDRIGRKLELIGGL